jgi:phage major head subunit gpT-like protein
MPIEAFLPTLEGVSMNSAKSIDSKIPKAFQVKTTNKVYTEEYSFAGIRPFSAWNGDGQIITRQSISPRFKTRITQAFYATAVAYTYKNKKFLKYDLLKEQAQLLGLQAANTKEMLAFSLINNGFATNWNDGVPLFSAAHPLANGSTDSNLVTGALSVTSFTAALTRLRSIKDDMGLPMGIKPVRLWVPIGLEGTAWEILKSAMRADTANNADNFLKARFSNIEIETSDQLTSSTAFFLQGDRGGLVFETSEEMDQQQYEAIDGTKNTIQEAVIGIGYGARDWRWGVGSLGY